MESFRKWLYKPKKDDTSLLAQFFYADEALNLVAAELDSFDGRKDPERCTSLVNQLRQCQDKVLIICGKIMNQLIPDDRSSRDFRVKFPDDVMQENLAGQLWFGAECLAAGSSIMNRECESTAMRPLAKAMTKSLETVRNLLREQCLRINANITSNYHIFNDKLLEALKIFDRLFAEFELSYVSAMVPVKTPREYYMQQLVVVLFSETLQRALRLHLLTQDTVDDYDPALMFTIPRLAIVSGLLVYPDGPLCPDRTSSDMSEMFRPFRALLCKIRELLWTLNKKELFALEKLLCSCEDLTNDNSSYSSKLDSIRFEEGDGKVRGREDERYDYIRYEDEEDEGASTSGNESDDESDQKQETSAPSPPSDEILPSTSTAGPDSGLASENDKDSPIEWNRNIQQNITEATLYSDACSAGRQEAEDDDDVATPPVDNTRFDIEMSPNCDQFLSHGEIFTSPQQQGEIAPPDDVSLHLPHSFVLPSTNLHLSNNNNNNSGSYSPPDVSYRIRTTTLSTLQSFDKLDRNKVISYKEVKYKNGERVGRIKRRKFRPLRNIMPNNINNNNNNINNHHRHRVSGRSPVTSLHIPSHDHSRLLDVSSGVGVGGGGGASISSSPSSSCSSCIVSDTCSVTSSITSSELPDDDEIELALQAAALAYKTNARSKFRSSEDLVHRLFVCIAGVADQLQTNFAGDLRNILKSVFLMNASQQYDENDELKATSQKLSSPSVGSELNRIENAMEAWESGPGADTQVVANEQEQNRSEDVQDDNPPEWIPDMMAPKCMTCQTVFTLVRRRHHCRNCGKVFCARCSSNSVPLPRYGHVKPVRVCNRCFLYQVTPFTMEELPTAHSH